MSLSRKIARRIERQDVYMHTHLENSTLPVCVRPSMALAGNTFSAMRRRFAEEARINAAARERAKLAGTKYEPVRLAPGKPAKAEDSIAKYNRKTGARARTADQAMLDALLFNTLPRAVRKGQLLLADYRKGVRV